MVTKHFFKALIGFVSIIIIVLIGVFLVSYFEEEGNLDIFNKTISSVAN